MAILKINTLAKGLSGTIGNLVFRQYNGKTIVSSKPSFSNRQTELQRNTRNKFKQASAYAKASMVQPDKKAYYLQRAKELHLTNAYTAALRDYLRNEHMEVNLPAIHTVAQN